MPALIDVMQPYQPLWIGPGDNGGIGRHRGRAAFRDERHSAAVAASLDVLPDHMVADAGSDKVLPVRRKCQVAAQITLVCQFPDFSMRGRVPDHERPAPG